MFDFFARHARPGKERVRIVDFYTASPGISSRNNWLEIWQQIRPLQISHVHMQFDPGKKRYFGTTENVARMALEIISPGPELYYRVMLDGDTLEVTPLGPGERIWLARDGGHWHQSAVPDPVEKSPARYGTFKDAIRHHVVFVVGTHGTTAENRWAAAKARYDAEAFWYQGNGSVDILTDDEFDPVQYADRGVVIYGNSTTNSAWDKLLTDVPVKVERGKVSFAGKTFSGNDLAVLFTWPRKDSETASVAVVAGSGITGMRMTDIRPYMYAGFALPDLVIFSSEIMKKGVNGVKVAGFFGNDWSVSQGEFAWGHAKSAK
jgi:hypothetical protein